MRQGDVLRGSYRLEDRLGKSPFAETWTATYTDGASRVTAAQEPSARGLVVKILSLGDMPDWKGYDHFEREASALKAMSHPSVPRYVDSFRWEDGEAHFLALVMERVPGESLAAVAEGGKRWTETEIESMFAELLEVLSYLHSLRPPIIHRDVTPKNLILKPDGTIALVDFSGVQDAVRLAYRDTATMVGTAGYAPVEQVSGRATVRSDLYAAAACAAFLLTRRHPSDLPVRGMKLDPGAIVELSVRLRRVLDNYLEPDEALRSLPPLEAAAILRGKAPEKPAYGIAGRVQENDWPEPYFGNDPGPEPVEGRPERLPADSRVTISDDAELYRLVIPRAGLGSPALLTGGGFAVFWLGFVAFWTFSAVRMGAPVFFSAFSLPFWAVGIFMVRTILRPALCSIDLTISREGGLILEERFLSARTRSWPLSDVGSCRVDVSAMAQRGRRERELVLEVGTKSIRFGRALSDRERRAISSSINSWLRKTGRN